MKVYIMQVFDSEAMRNYHIERIPEELIEAFKSTTKYYHEISIEESEEK